MRAMHSTSNQTTRLLYLEDQNLPEAEAIILDISRNGDTVLVVLNRTPMYVKRGGQPGDAGIIEGEDVSIAVRDVVYAEDGHIAHVGNLQSRMPVKGEKVTVKVDSATRRLHSLWHSAGEAVIVAAKMAGFDEPVGAAIHYGPNQNRIEYQAKLDSEQAQRLKEQIETNLVKIIQDDTPVVILNLTDKNEVVQHCGFWPDYVPEGETIRVVKVRSDYTGRPCTGTHLTRTSELGKIWVEKIKVKGDKVIISYKC